MTQTDEQLWQRVCNNDPSAWRDLVLRYKALVYTVCTHTGLSQADAADCFQQTWLQLYQYRHRLEQPSRIASWLVTTAKREALRVLYRSRRLVDDSAIDEYPDGSPGPDAELELLENQAHLELALREIDTPCRQLLELFFLADQDYSYDDIADRMGLAPNTLGAKRQRCLGKLRQILKKFGIG